MTISAKSMTKLLSCDKRLQDVILKVAKTWDILVIEGHRGEEAQNKAFENGFTKLKFPHGKHNKNPSMAVDISPEPYDAKDRERITFLAGYVMSVADTMGVSLRWGGDWNGDKKLKDNNFDDLFHFQIEE